MIGAFEKVFCFQVVGLSVAWRLEVLGDWEQVL